MTQRITPVVLLAALAALAGCAGAPPVAPAGAPAAAGVAPERIARSAATAADDAPAAAEQPTSTPPTPAAITRFPGTRPRLLPNGQTVYCWTEKKLGTRLLKETCATAEVLEQQGPAARDVFEQMRATKSGCNPSQPGGC